MTPGAVVLSSSSDPWSPATFDKRIGAEPSRSCGIRVHCELVSGPLYCRLMVPLFFPLGPRLKYRTAMRCAPFVSTTLPVLSCAPWHRELSTTILPATESHDPSLDRSLNWYVPPIDMRTLPVQRTAYSLKGAKKSTGLKLMVGSTRTNAGSCPKMKGGQWQLWPVRILKYSPVSPSPNLPWNTALFTRVVMPQLVTSPCSSFFLNLSIAIGSPTRSKPNALASSGGTVSSQTKSQVFNVDEIHEAGMSALCEGSGFSGSLPLGVPATASSQVAIRSQILTSRISPSKPW
mmetsp:Transcript_29239/g.66241  ORF Transcript_29239/g.66241 Transcript_29239/m.66241 type:complete len:290 (-) Transcript_29239:3330-4199(-)